MTTESMNENARNLFIIIIIVCCSNIARYLQALIDILAFNPCQNKFSPFKIRNLLIQHKNNFASNWKYPSPPYIFQWISSLLAYSMLIHRFSIYTPNLWWIFYLQKATHERNSLAHNMKMIFITFHTNFTQLCVINAALRYGNENGWLKSGTFMNLLEEKQCWILFIAENTVFGIKDVS